MNRNLQQVTNECMENSMDWNDEWAEVDADEFGADGEIAEEREWRRIQVSVRTHRECS